MGRRVPLLGLTFAVALSLAVAGVVLVIYDAHGAWLTLAIVAPLAIVTVLAGEWIAARRPGGLRRQFALVAALGALQLAAGVVLFVALMFVSSHDALLTVLLAVYAAALDALDRAQARRAGVRGPRRRSATRWPRWGRAGATCAPG